MKYKAITSAAVAAFLGVLLYLGVSKLKGYPAFSNGETLTFIKPIKTGHEGETIASFNILTSDDLTCINTKDAPKNKPVVLFYFYPDCPFCRAEMRDIVEGMEYLKDIQFYLLTPYSLSDIRVFGKSFHLDKYPNISIGIDSKSSFSEYFKVPAVPYTVIYNREKKLVGAFGGGLSYKQIERVAHE